MDNFMYSENELVDEWDTLNTAFVYSKPMEGWTSLWVAEELNQCTLNQSLGGVVEWLEKDATMGNHI